MQDKECTNFCEGRFSPPMDGMSGLLSPSDKCGDDFIN